MIANGSHGKYSLIDFQIACILSGTWKYFSHYLSKYRKFGLRKKMLNFIKPLEFSLKL